MSRNNEKLIAQFYSAFQRGDYETMQSLYHPEAVFSDPVFTNLSSDQVKSMWEMLLTSAKDLKVEFESVIADQHSGSCFWEAWYTFSKTGRPVHNMIQANFQFKDGLILRHTDSFDLWRWSRMALGLSGTLLGWTPLLQGKIRTMAAKNLAKFRSRK